MNRSDYYSHAGPRRLLLNPLEHLKSFFVCLVLTLASKSPDNIDHEYNDTYKIAILEETLGAETPLARNFYSAMLRKMRYSNFSLCSH